MSSPKAARGKARKTGAKAAPKKAPAKKAIQSEATKAVDASAQAFELAVLIERELSNGNTGVLSQAALQDLTAALCKTYSARVEAGEAILPLRGRTAVSSTDIMTTASGLLKAANLAVFELGMWQSWTGR
jgi:hypothetical protein